MSLEQRLKKLEHRCHWLSVALVVCLSIVGVAVVCGAQNAEQPKVLRVAGIEIVDGQGKVRIHIGDTGANVFGAVFNGEDGKTRAVISDSAQLTLREQRFMASLSASDVSASLRTYPKTVEPL